MRNFRELKVWEKSHELALAVYRTSAGFPREELYGVTSQLRRAGTSVPANIAEGCGRGSNPDLGRFLQVAMGSASELEYHLLFARDAGILNSDDYERLSNDAVEVKKMLAVLIEKVRLAPTGKGYKDRKAGTHAPD